MTLARIERIWPGSTVVCIATGPSLTQEDVDYCRGKAKVIAINDAYRMAPWADVLYACDDRWWAWHKGAPEFAGLKFSLKPDSRKWPGVQVLQSTGIKGLEKSPTGLRTGQNSGYQAIGLAVHSGASKVALIGYDMQRTGGREHCFGDHPNRSRSPYADFIRYFNSLVEPLKAAGVTVVNCSRESALESFPRLSLQEALA